MRMKMRAERMVQDVEILTSGERKRVVSLEKEKINTYKPTLSEKG